MSRIWKYCAKGIYLFIFSVQSHWLPRNQNETKIRKELLNFWLLDKTGCKCRILLHYQLFLFLLWLGTGRINEIIGYFLYGSKMFTGIIGGEWLKLRVGINKANAGTSLDGKEVSYLWEIDYYSSYSYWLSNTCEVLCRILRWTQLSL